jgi:hypothetical protein
MTNNVGGCLLENKRHLVRCSSPISGKQLGQIHSPVLAEETATAGRLGTSRKDLDGNELVMIVGKTVGKAIWRWPPAISHSGNERGHDISSKVLHRAGRPSTTRYLVLPRMDWSHRGMAVPGCSSQDIKSSELRARTGSRARDRLWRIEWTMGELSVDRAVSWRGSQRRGQLNCVGRKR